MEIKFYPKDEKAFLSITKLKFLLATIRTKLFLIYQDFRSVLLL